ncbi:hypothetical protein MASR1M32_04280 [Rhodobacter sp.]
MSDRTPDKDHEPEEDRAEAVAPLVLDESERIADTAAPPPARRRGAGSAVLAVLLLGAGATALAWFDPLGWRGPGQAQDQIAALTARLEASDTAAKALEARLARLESAPPAVSPDSLAALEQSVHETQAALTALQQAPGVGEDVSAAQIAALAQTVEQLKQQVAALPATAGSTEGIKAAVDAAMDERAAQQEAEASATVEAAQKKVARIEAVQSLRAAAQSGAPYADLLPALGDLPLDPVLRDAAASGLVTRQALVDGFPDAARKALDASLRATGGEGMGDRLYTFLRIQTGARSLEPQEGSDPDAVLSRAEAAVQSGDVAGALDELAALPAEGQAEMKEWMAQAQGWLAADKALNDLAAAAGVQGG